MGRGRIAKQILDEQLGTTYADILAHFPAARMKVIHVFGALQAIEDQATDEFLASTRRPVLPERRSLGRVRPVQRGLESRCTSSKLFAVDPAAGLFVHREVWRLAERRGQRSQRVLAARRDAEFWQLRQHQARR